MYKQVETDSEAIWVGGTVFKPVATLAAEYGRAQITEDDGCYVLLLRQESGLYRPTLWIFPEAFEVLKSLPSLTESKKED